MRGRLLAVLGATGYTGRLVVADARRLGLPLRLVGRAPAALGALAAVGEEVRVADARDPGALERAFAGASVVVSCAGPFARLGLAPVRAALEARAHYVDTSAEQPFARLVREGLGDEAARARVCLLTSFGFDYALGDLAAAVAAAGLGPVQVVRVGYAVSGLVPSRGTRRTMGELMRHGHDAWVGGALVPSRFGATAARLLFPSGAADVVEWGGTEPLTVPRHVDVAEVRSYVRLPRAAAIAGRVAPAFAPLVSSLGGIGPSGAGEAIRRRARFAVVAEALVEGGGGARATITGRDVYGVTARLVAEGARSLLAGEVDAVGAPAPAEAFEARALLGRLAPLAGIRSVEGL
jgi:short subunit dehydrogenase-like uncharacterized protein